jgi:hypothetical protein
MRKIVLAVLLCAAAGASAQSNPDWQTGAGGSLPPWATPAGWEADGSPLYIARAPFNGGVQVGKVNPARPGAYISWGGTENTVPAFEVYCGTGRWVPGTAASVPPRAIAGGREADGTPLYIIRAPFQGSMVPGKFNPAFRKGYLPWGGKEVEIASFEILVQDWTPIAGVRPPAGTPPLGAEANGAPLYVIRAHVGNAVVPGKLNPANGKGYVGYGGREVELTSGMEAFLGTGVWVAAADGEIPFGAIGAGVDDGGSPLFIVRAGWQGGTHLGTISAATGRASIPYGGQEVEVVAYEVLCYAFGPAQ